MIKSVASLARRRRLWHRQLVPSSSVPFRGLSQVAEGDEEATATQLHRPSLSTKRRTQPLQPSFRSPAIKYSRHLSTESNVDKSISTLSKEAATAPVDYPTSSRFLALPPAIAIHLSIGSVYVYSMWTPGLSKALGVITAAPNDWTHTELLPVFSTAAVVLGVTTSALGEWVERVGPRTAGMVGSVFWSGALLTSAVGVEMHALPLVYLGYGIMGGVGWGLLYLTPVTSAMKWFPDRRGLATGIALSAFGAGAALAPSLIHYLVDSFAVAPLYIGDCLLTSSVGGEISQPLVELTTLSDGSQVVASNSPVGEAGTPVVVATEADVAKCSGLVTTPAGVYAIVGTGDTGISKALASMGVLCGGLGALGSRFMQIPHPEWKPDGNDDSTKSAVLTDTNESTNSGLPASYVTTNTKQFPLLWFSVFGNATGGLALLSSSKLMLTDIFAGVAQLLNSSLVDQNSTPLLFAYP